MEIDPVVVELAGQYFNFVEDAQMRVHIEDGGAYLRRNPQEKWDAFSTGGRLPFQLLTREFIEKLKTHLTEIGMLLANLTSALDGEA